MKSTKKKPNETPEEKRAAKAAYLKKWWAENRESQRVKKKKAYIEKRGEILAKAKEWRKANPEKAKERARKSYFANKESKLLSAKKWAAANPEKKRAIQREWFRKNSQKISEKKKKRHAEDPLYRARISKYGARYRAANPERIKEITKRYLQSHPLENKRRVDELDDCYVATLLHLPVESLRKHPDLLESHREVVRLKRQFSQTTKTEKP